MALEMATRSSLHVAFFHLPLALLLVILATLTGPSMAGQVLYTNEYLAGGQYLSVNLYKFIMQYDCNLVLYDSGRAVWSSGTYGRASGCRAKMQDDGNLVIYSGSGSAVWASRTNREKAPYTLTLQQDRNVVIYGPRGAIWATNTKNNGIGDSNIPKVDGVSGRKVNPAGADAAGVKASNIPKDSWSQSTTSHAGVGEEGKATPAVADVAGVKAFIPKDWSHTTSHAGVGEEGKATPAGAVAGEGSNN